MSRYVTLYLVLGVCMTGGQKRPNIVVILTDDQDVTMGGTTPLKAARHLIAESGAEFTNAFATTPICCPSRSSVLTGRYLHNTGVRNNTIAGGCSSTKWQEELETKTFAVMMKKAGYRTMYAGKYLNQYGAREVGGVSHVPPGWDWWIGLVGNSKYYNYTLSINGKAQRHGDDYVKDYLTDVIRRQSIRFLDRVSRSSKPDSPFLMVLAPPAAHAPFTPAPQFKDRFRAETAPRTKAFNRDTSKDPAKHWLMMSQPRTMSNETVNKVDEVFRNRWRTLLSVDVMVEKVVHALEQYKLLDNTYILLTSDHGYHLGQFGMPLDKRLPYDFDIKIPFWMRGPNITRGQSVEVPVLTIDIAPTLLDLAGIPDNNTLVTEMDGLSICPLVLSKNGSNDTASNMVQRSSDHPSVETNVPSILSNISDIQGRHSFLVEYSGEAGTRSSSDSCAQALKHDLDNLAECSQEFDCKCQDARNNTYTCIRTLGQENSLFCEFKDHKNTIEMYNIAQDPLQLTNLAGMLSAETLDHYKKQISKLTNCKGEGCNNL